MSGYYLFRQDNGKPHENVGRKASDLPVWLMVAGLPNGVSISFFHFENRYVTSLTLLISL